MRAYPEGLSLGSYGIVTFLAPNHRRVPRDFRLHVGFVPERAVEVVPGLIQTQRQEFHYSDGQNFCLFKEGFDFGSELRAVAFARPLVRPAQNIIRRWRCFRININHNTRPLHAELHLFSKIGFARGVLGAERDVPAKRGRAFHVHFVFGGIIHRKESARRPQRTRPGGFF